jgi:hypothetical protein
MRQRQVAQAYPSSAQVQESAVPDFGTVDDLKAAKTRAPFRADYCRAQRDMTTLSLPSGYFVKSFIRQLRHVLKMQLKQCFLKAN